MERGRRGLAAAVAAVIVSGCVSHTAPDGFLPTPAQAGLRSSGGWVDVMVQDGEAPLRVRGELIAVTADTLWVVGTDGGSAFPTSHVIEGRFFSHVGQHGHVIGATALGVVSTLSNGVLLTLTAPMWLIGGSAAAAAQSRVGMEGLPTEEWVELRTFARFPQGLPAEVDVATLRPNPLLLPPAGPDGG